MIRHFGDAIRMYRRHKGISQEKLADAIGVGITTIERMEKGNSKYRKVSTLVSIAKVLDMDAQQLCHLAHKVPDEYIAKKFLEAKRYFDKRCKKLEDNLKQEKVDPYWLTVENS